MKTVFEKLRDRLASLHSNQSGAIALLVLAAVMICMMLALVIYDTTPAARQKLEVQGAADVAAYSQSAIEARSMNMIAFANIGKRIVVGQTLFYESLWFAFGELLLLTVAAAIVACIAAFFTGGALAKLCEFLVNTAIEIGLMMADEAQDLASFLSRIKDYAKEDVEAFDKYQVYFDKLTPWWSWSEQYIRGMRNGAVATAGWPVPRNALSILPSVPGIGNLGSGLEDELPIERDDDWGELCVRSFAPDLIAHEIDYALQIATCGNDCLKEKNPLAFKGTRAVVYVIVGLLAAANYGAICLGEKAGVPNFVTWTFGTDHYPFQLKDPGDEAKWLRSTSNLIFAYRPGRDFSTDFRRKYGFLSPDYNSSLDVLYEADGFLGMARSEISFQTPDEDPDLWHTSWTARMRPVALPGEWAGYGSMRMVSAFHDAVPYLAGTSALGGIIEGAVNMGTPEPADLLKAEMAFDSMNNDFIDGVAR